MIIDSGVDVKGALRSSAASLGNTMRHELSQSDAEESNSIFGVEELILGLSNWGFEPHRDGSSIVLRNCPFNAIARAYPDLVCQMNLELIQAFMLALSDSVYEPIFDSSKDRCCVVLHEKGEIVE